MGMDVYGLHPTSKVGEYFRRSVWGWHPLATYTCEVAPDLCAKAQYWHSNDGDGLDADNAHVLGQRLLAEIASGRTAAYVARRDAEIAAMPDERCRRCRGTGTFYDGKQCYMCSGKGQDRPMEAAYRLDVSDVAEWAQFLLHCGGFEIN